MRRYGGLKFSPLMTSLSTHGGSDASVPSSSQMYATMSGPVTISGFAGSQDQKKVGAKARLSFDLVNPEVKF
jgi:hypothetical protein